jgi:hypothetical protein
MRENIRADTGSWRDPAAAWWAKATRARKHIQDIRAMATTFEASDPYEIRRVDDWQEGAVAYRFHSLRPVPVELLVTIGDALHNLRSCLDSVAFELARQHLRDAMTEEEERAAQFRSAGTGTSSTSSSTSTGSGAQCTHHVGVTRSAACNRSPSGRKLPI